MNLMGCILVKGLQAICMTHMWQRQSVKQWPVQRDVSPGRAAGVGAGVHCADSRFHSRLEQGELAPMHSQLGQGGLAPRHSQPGRTERCPTHSLLGPVEAVPTEAAGPAAAGWLSARQA